MSTTALIPTVNSMRWCSIVKCQLRIPHRRESPRRSLALRCPRLCGRNFRDLGLERAFGMPKIVGLLHPQPQLRAVAAEFAEPDRHFGTDRRLFSENPMQMLARQCTSDRACLRDPGEG